MKKIIVVLAMVTCLLIMAGVVYGKSAGDKGLETYIVQPEENISDVTIMLGVSVTEIKRWNPGLNVNKIKAGDKINYKPLSTLMKEEQAKTQANIFNAQKKVEGKVRKEAGKTRKVVKETSVAIGNKLEEEGKAVRKKLGETAEEVKKKIANDEATRFWMVVCGIIAAVVIIIGFCLVLRVLSNVNKRTKKLTGESTEDEMVIHVEGNFSITNGEEKKFKYIYIPLVVDGAYQSLHALETGNLFRTTNIEDLKRSVKGSLKKFYTLKGKIKEKIVLSETEKELFKKLEEIITKQMAENRLIITEI